MPSWLKYFLFFIFLVSFAAVILFDREMSGKDDFAFLKSEDQTAQKSHYSIKKAVIDDPEKIKESYEKRGERIEALKEVGRELSGNK